MSEISLKKGKVLYSAFHLQQSMEKTLKGLFVLLRGEQPPYLHDLFRPADEIKGEIVIDTRFLSFFSELNPFYSDVDFAVVSRDFAGMDGYTALKILNRLRLKMDPIIEPIALLPIELQEPEVGSVVFDIAQGNRLLFKAEY